MNRLQWQPLLTGSDADRAWQVVLDIAEALRDPEDQPHLSSEEAAAGRAYTLAEGTAGTALFYAYLSLAHEGDWAHVAESHFDHALAGLSEHELSPGLYSGFPGIGWAYAHLSGLLFEEDTQSSEAFQGAIAQLLSRDHWEGPYDLISGLVGLAVYALEAAPAPGAKACLDLASHHLDELATLRSEGHSWLTPPEMLPDYQREKSPGGYYNLGVAHGVPGVLPILAAADAAGIDRTGALLESATRWTLARRNPEGAESVFPHWEAVGGFDASCRLAWCYGDAGVAASLLATALCAGREDWKQTALEVGTVASRRSFESAGLTDYGLCHGSAGLGHLFNRMYQASGEPALADAARRWLRVTLDHRQPGRGVAGYAAWESRDDSGQMEWRPRRGFLLGAAGIGLALLAGITPIAGDWDRLLLASLPGTAPAGAAS